MNGAAPRARGYEDFDGVVTERASTSTPSWTKDRRPGPKAPNVIVLLMDDMGFADLSPYGGEIRTPNIERLAADGYVLTNYHTTPMCAPSRASIMTGLNPHRAGFGWVPHADPGYPGWRMQLPPDAPTLAESFRSAGYATFMVGKWHLTPEAKMHDGATKETWPLQRGFDRYLGCMDGFTSLFHPHRLVRDNSPADIDVDDDFFLTDHLTDEAIDMVRTLRANDQDRPFFLYFAHQAVHGPVQAPEEDIERYRGRYDAGWDTIREERFRRQLELGIVPEHARLPEDREAPPFDVEPWDAVPEEDRALLARYMEAYAASIDNADQNLGRLLDALAAMGELENTIVVFSSDNGGTAEGGTDGTRSYLSHFGHHGTMPEHWVRDVPRETELVGGPRTYVHYPRGWARTSNTPFRMFKQHTLSGGVRVPLLVSWPAGLPRTADDDGYRRGFTYVTDVPTTLLELTGVEREGRWPGAPVTEADGRSFAELLRGEEPGGDQVDEEERGQHFELDGRRAYIAGRWKIVSTRMGGPGWDPDEWQLYDIAKDPTETTDLATHHPDVVARLAERWTADAWAGTVFPIDDDGSHKRVTSGYDPSGVALPVRIPPGLPTLERVRSSALTNGRSFAIECTADGGEEGVLVSHGDQGGGYLVAVEDGNLVVAYNEYGRMEHARASLTTGPRPIEVRFELDDVLRWTVTGHVAGEEVLRLGPVLALLGMAPFAGITVGRDGAGPVDWDLSRRRGRFPYTGPLAHVAYRGLPTGDVDEELMAHIEEESAKRFE